MPTILSELKISENSLVDRPACAEIDPVTGMKVARATVALWKRDSTVSKAVKYLVSGADGDHLPYTGEDGKPDHRLMGAAWAALHDGYRGNKYEGPGKAGALSKLKQVYEGEGMETPAEKTNKGEGMTLEQIEKKLTDQDGLIAAMKAENEILKTDAEVAKMSEKCKAAFGKWSDEKKKEYMSGDDKKKASMMADEEDEADTGDSDESAKKIAKAEQVYKADLAKRDERIAKLEADNLAIQAARRLEHFAKRAETELAHTSGSPIEKAQTLIDMADSLGGESGDRFKRAFGVMKAADAVLASEFVEKGVWGGGSNISEVAAQIDAKAAEIRKRDGVSEAVAQGRAIRENPGLYAQYAKERETTRA